MKELLHYIKKLYSYSGKILYINLAGMVVVSLLDGVAILFLIPMLSVSGILSLSEGPSTLWGLSNGLTSFPVMIGLTIILGAYLFLVLCQNFLQRSITIRDIKLQQGFMNQIKEQVYQNLLEVKWEFYLRNRKSYIINTMTKDITRVTMGIKMFMQFLTNIVFTLMQIGLAFWISPQISSLVVICGLGLAFFSWRFVKQSKDLGKENIQLSQEYLAGMSDNLHAIKDIKTNSLEASRMFWLKSLNSKMLMEQVNFTKIQTNSQVIYKFVLAFILSAFILLAVTFVQTRPDQLLIVILIFGRLWPRFVTIQFNLQQLALMLPSFKILYDLQSETSKAKEIKTIPTQEYMEINEKIECKNVHFKYKGNHHYALQGISLEIPAKSMTAVIGESGAGKSTLVDLLMGLNLPESGAVIIDGIPLKEENLLSYRKQVGYVPQNPFLFHTSIKENLLIMNPEATESQLWEALEIASAAEFVRRLPEGLGTEIGDQGIRLSGGERQRLVLARTLLRKPALLVLDEPTSALDPENDEKIQRALQKLKQSMTIIIIAHRMSTIRHADQIIELEKGQILVNNIQNVKSIG
ncbi:ABC transporter ATP-binding protein [Bacillus sp. AK128]